MNTKDKQLHGLFEANDATTISNSELQDMKELFAYSFDDFSNEVEQGLALFSPMDTSMFSVL